MGDVVENSIFDVWKSVYPTLADTILFIFCVAMFFWFRATIKNTMARFTEMMTLNTRSVKDHLDAYNATHQKNWDTLSELVVELKDKKVWQNEYLMMMQNVQDKGTYRDERIRDLDERLKCLERKRRPSDGGGTR